LDFQLECCIDWYLLRKILYITRFHNGLVCGGEAHFVLP
jgi:hypothetical protein